MLGVTRIKGVGKVNTVLLLSWETKGKKKSGYKIVKFRMYLHQDQLNLLPEVTKNKLNLFMSELNTLWKLKKIKTELDLEIFTNRFATENGVGFLFDGKRHFSKHYVNEPINVSAYKKIDDKYYKERYKYIKKHMIKLKQRE